MDQNLKKILTIAGVALGAYALYKVLEGDKPKDAVEAAVKVPVKVVETTAKKIEQVGRRLIKGSAEAKEHMQKLADMRKQIGRKQGGKNKKKSPQEKGGEATAKLGKHKGHATKKGLAQDQKLTSQEPHEVDYQKTHDVRSQFEKEQSEHPELPKSTIRKFVKDHKKKTIIFLAKIDYGDRTEETQLILPKRTSIKKAKVAFEKLGGPNTKVSDVRKK